MSRVWPQSPLGYDTDGRLTGIGVPGVESLGFSYDAANRITGIDNAFDGTLSQDFGYDEQSRLVSVYSGTDNEGFQYDASGNRLMQTGTVDTVSSTSNRLTGAGGISYGYNALGNTTTVNGAATYHYNAFNRLDSAGGMAYYVNPEGQRLRKTGAAGSLAKWTSSLLPSVLLHVLINCIAIAAALTYGVQ